MKKRIPILHENLPLLEVAEKMTLDILFADTHAHRYLAKRLSDTVAVVYPGQFDSLLARLKTLGHTPKVLDE